MGDELEQYTHAASGAPRAIDDPIHAPRIPGELRRRDALQEVWRAFLGDEGQLGGIAMNLAPPELRDLMVEIAAKRIGNRFLRRELMDATECEVRQRGLWTPEDDRGSESAGPKSRGLAEIDWAFSSLAEQKRILRIRRGEWRLPDENP